MKIRLGALLGMLCAVLWLPGQAQVNDQLIAEMIQAQPGTGRAESLCRLAHQEREQGHSTRALEYAMLATIEAERSIERVALPGALLELTRAQHQTQDLEGAIRSGLRGISLVSDKDLQKRPQILFEMAAISLELHNPVRALEYLAEVGNLPDHQTQDRMTKLRLEAEARKKILAPTALLQWLSSHINEAIEHGDPATEVDFLAKLATAHASTGDTLRAMELEEHVLAVALKHGQAIQAGIAANNLAELTSIKTAGAKKMELYQQAIILMEDAPLLCRGVLVNSAVAYALQGNFVQAKRQLTDAQANCRERADASGQLIVQRTLAMVMLYEGDVSGALTQAGSALKAAKGSEDAEEQARLSELLAAIHLLQGDAIGSRNYERAARAHREAHLTQREVEERQAANERSRIQGLEREYLERLNSEQKHRSELVQLELTNENQEQRLALLLAEKNLEESGRRAEVLSRERAQKELQLTEAALEVERNERLITDLENTKLLQAMSMDRMSMERQQRQRDMEQLEQRNQVVEAKTLVLEMEQTSEKTKTRYSLLGAIAMLTLAAYMAWAWSIQRKKKRTIIMQKKAIESFNEELEAKNQDIESSLRYARTIQAAIVPDESRLKTLLPDSFLYYKPLANVSGDLPYVQQVGDLLYIAAIDCTGHGVPAAMMTFIAYYGLNEIIAKEPNAGCGRLLDLLHEHVAETMRGRQKVGGYDDGFDIGLCRINRRTGEMIFSGAQLPVLVMSGNTLTRIKGDIVPLGDGHFERNKGYKEHNLQLQQGDLLFLLSDGAIHQFGGTHGQQKFSMKRLEGTIVERMHEPMTNIREATIEALESWKGDYPQTDDILIMGLRFAA